MDRTDFAAAFEELTGHTPYRWQVRMYNEMCDGHYPEACNLPTGMGKTSIIVLWLLALVTRDACRVPRKLVYVVNRRTVVDQSTRVVEGLRDRLTAQRGPFARQISTRLQDMSALGGGLAVSTLRGQLADNGEWSQDPTQPAIICGTVDMIGSRLLWSGYRIGWKTRPHHAALLGWNTLLLHDEAHLEPAFAALLESLVAQQWQDGADRIGVPGLQVCNMSATTREQGGDVWSLGDYDMADPEIRRRYLAHKSLAVCPPVAQKDLAAEISGLAMSEYEDQACAVLIYCTRLVDVHKVAKALPKERTLKLTGTMRGFERDMLVDHPIMRRFFGTDTTTEGTTVYLVCSSAGEVGIDIDADHMVCDMAPWDSMCQRLGRVNRAGTKVSEVTVFPLDKYADNPYAQACEAAIECLQGCAMANSGTLNTVPPSLVSAAMTPSPEILPLTWDLCSKWAMTSIEGGVPGQPPVAPYLHGIAEYDAPRVQVAWREEVQHMRGEMLRRHSPEELLDDFRVLPHEILQDTAKRVGVQLTKLACSYPGAPVWLVRGNDVEVTTMKQCAAYIASLGRLGTGDTVDVLVLLPPSVGGLAYGGELDGASRPEVRGQLTPGYDIASARGDRVRQWDQATTDSGDATPQQAMTAAGYEVTKIIDFYEEDDPDEENLIRRWTWYRTLRGVAPREEPEPVMLLTHAQDVTDAAAQICSRVGIAEDIQDAVVLAASHHDNGKASSFWQRVMGNDISGDASFDVCWAKPPRWASGRGRMLLGYRHELGSLVGMPSECWKHIIAKHVVAAHHGRARPSFPATAARTEAERAEIGDTAQRYAAMVRRYGLYGTAYIESLLRAADWYVSSR